MERSIWLPRQANYFFALLPNPAAAVSADHMAGALRNWLGLSGSPRGIGKYHVTLWNWSAEGGPEAQGISLMCRVAERVRQRSFKLAFDEVATFAQAAETPALVMTGRDSVIGAHRLHLTLDREMRVGGFHGKRPSCQPHLTLLYDRFRTKAFRVKPLSWRVTDFVLIRSIAKQPYEILGRWALANP
ncbi:2'-5' RNA ligase [Hyphomicrobiales bacterium]|nr:2'-5' RNA ligase [Hyphomicrobiales bacterium]CAH1701950.1 2'-5' RNA ligase [Hyphomicrobiales bacterium]CAI0346107.1 RNA 2',3'-cyclic 3'-phosphodiesterase [Hyphomicrobiales bacterium]